MRLRQAKKLSKLTQHQADRLSEKKDQKYSNHHCSVCGRFWNLNQNQYFVQHGTCDARCYQKLIEEHSPLMWCPLMW